jgi:hypothetical protein
MVATVAVLMLLGGLAYLLMAGLPPRLHEPDGMAATAVALTGAALLMRDRRRHVLLPGDLVRARNCLPANGATFALYFGLFGLSFVVVLYTQQVLDYSAIRAALVLLPGSLMLLLAERFGRLTAVIGTRPLVFIGAAAAAGGLVWLALGTHPLSFWARLRPGSALVGLGVSLAVSPLTHAAVAAVPETCAGAASGLNHAVVRVAGLVAVALLGSIAAPGFSERVSADGVRFAMLVAAAVVAAGGVAGGLLLRDDEPGGIEASS